MPGRYWYFLSVVLLPLATAAQTLNGFDISRASVPTEAILHGGPPRDGIPAIDQPRFVPVGQAGFLKPDDTVLGIVIDGVARAYPIRILNWHELVNDSIGDHPFVVSYCPLCGTGMVFDAEIDGQALDFGVSGLLYNSDVLLYDRQRESLWSQIMAEAISGPHRGRELEQIPVTHTRFSHWRAQHPDTQVLSTDTGHNRDYTHSPYQGYVESARTYFPLQHQPPARYHPKERVLGVRFGDSAKAYPYSELDRHGDTPLADRVGDQKLQVHWNREARSAWLTDPQGKPLASVSAFWFAWYAFYPRTAVWTAADGKRD